jgi:hypothetical protein
MAAVKSNDYYRSKQVEIVIKISVCDSGRSSDHKKRKIQYLQLAFETLTSNPGWLQIWNHIKRSFHFLICFRKRLKFTVGNTLQIIECLNKPIQLIRIFFDEKYSISIWATLDVSQFSLVKKNFNEHRLGSCRTGSRQQFPLIHLF